MKNYILRITVWRYQGRRPWYCKKFTLRSSHTQERSSSSSSYYFYRCPQYTNIGTNCEFAPDPKDPSCCQMPECYPTGTVNFTSGNQIPTPAPSGTYVGQGIGLGMRISLLLSCCLTHKQMGIMYCQCQYNVIATFLWHSFSVHWDISSGRLIASQHSICISFMKF